MFIVIDGSALLTTHYYGTLPYELRSNNESEEEKISKYNLIKHNSRGDYVNGVESVLYSIFEILINNPVDRMVVCFDKTRNTFRKELYPEYKANRTEKPVPLKQQFDTLQTILDHIGIKTLASDTYEADDLAGSVIEHFKCPFEDMYFVTKDHDWLQLIDDVCNVKGLMVYNTEEKADNARNQFNHLDENNPFSNCSFKIPSKMVCFDEKAVLETEGVLPCQIADKKGLAGDTSDNIPGVYKIGSTTATALLAKYETIDNLYSQIENLDMNQLLAELATCRVSKKACLNLVDDKEIALLSKKLATIVTDCKDIPKDYNEYKVHIDADALTKAIEYYKLDSLEGFMRYYE